MTIPKFDSPRPARGFDGVGERTIQHETTVTMRVDETDEWIDVPIRSVYLTDGLSGWSFEIGPYSIAGPDATKLINALAHFGRLSGDFKQVQS